MLHHNKYTLRISIENEELKMKEKYKELGSNYLQKLKEYR